MALNLIRKDDGFALIKALSEAYENRKRFVAVGDDDLCKIVMKR
jgi:hypothetical protein